MKTAIELAEVAGSFLPEEKGYFLMQEMSAMLRQQAEQIEQLGRWKSTHAPRIAALEGLLATAQRQVSTSRESAQMLESERQANAILTDENEVLKADAERYQWYVVQLESGNLDKLEETFKGLERVEIVTKQMFDAAIDAMKCKS